MSTLNNRNTHLLIAGAAAGLAIVLPRNSKWRVPLSTLAALELGNALISYQPDIEEESQINEVAAPEVSHSAIINGIEMRWEEHGDTSSKSIPIVMVHGIPTSPRLWRYIIPKVEREGIRCLAWEQVGFGWSMEEGFDRDISVAKQAEYLHDWLEHMGITRAVFVGHDLGGGVIQQLLTKHPKLCMGLVLADCVAYDNWPVMPVKVAKSMNQMIEKLPPSMIKPIFLSGLFFLGHNSGPKRKESTDLHMKPYERVIGPKAFAHQLRNLHGEDTAEIADQLPRITAPAHVVWGEADPLGIKYGEKLAADLDAPFTRIPKGRHFSPEDHPNEIAAAINQVLRELE